MEIFHDREFGRTDLQPDPTVLELPSEQKSDANDFLTGVASLEARFGDDPEALAFNAAMVLVNALRVSQDAVATGKDVHIQGIDSQEFALAILHNMVQPDSRVGYRALMEFFATESRTSWEDMCHMVGDYMEIIRKHRTTNVSPTIQERQLASVELGPATTHFLHLAERFIDKELDGGIALPHEGGDPNFFDMELLRDICDPIYVSFMYDDKSVLPTAQSNSNITGQVRLRLISQARSMGMVEPNEDIHTQ